LVCCSVGAAIGTTLGEGGHVRYLVDRRPSRRRGAMLLPSSGTPRCQTNDGSRISQAPALLSVRRGRNLHPSRRAWRTRLGASFFLVVLPGLAFAPEPALPVAFLIGGARHPPALDSTSSSGSGEYDPDTTS